MDYFLLYQQIRSAEHALHDYNNVTSLRWGIKQDLYQLKDLIESILATSPIFDNENEWLEKRKKDKIIEILRR